MSLATRELERLKSELIRITQLVRNTIYATKRLIETSELEKRKELWSEIENTVILLDSLRREYVNEVLLYIAREQPLGKDLLTAHIFLSIAYDGHRISRYCREMAKIDSMLAPTSGLNKLVNVSSAFEEAIKAVEAALEDLIELRARRVDIVKEIDTRIDETYRSILLEITSSHTLQRETAVKALIMRHIERIVDHAHYIEQYLEESVK